MKLHIPGNKTGAIWLSVICTAFSLGICDSTARPIPTRPNVLLVIADQWRCDAFGFAGNPDVHTPNLDLLAKESIRCVNAISSLPVCCPFRASLLTGQRPLTHGVFLNDVPLDPNANSIAKCFARAGYDTGYIGKWHLNGDGRSAFIPRDRRQGFDYWKVLECTHDYNHSAYYTDTPEKKQWEGYDTVAQTHDAINYLREHALTNRPWFLVLAWGPPHEPYQTAPEKYRRLYSADRISLRPNVPESAAAQTRRDLAGYYAHCTALDDCMGELRKALKETGLEQNTTLIFTSDHGDMLGSHGQHKKQRPWEESIHIPLLIHWPQRLGTNGREDKSLISPEDLMPTILELSSHPIPKTTEGKSAASQIIQRKKDGNDAVVIRSVAPFADWSQQRGGKEFRGVRTGRYTYVRDLTGPWLLYDNLLDPFQTNNLVNAAAAAPLQKNLERVLNHKLKEQHDNFQPAAEYIKQWHYTVDATGTVPYER